MRRFVVLGMPFCTFVVLFGHAPVAYAATMVNGLPKTICAPGTHIQWSNPIFSKEGGTEEFKKLVQKNNFCTNERVSLGGMVGNSLQDQLTCICTNQQQFDKVGCGVGQIQPTVTSVIPRHQTGCRSDAVAVSKCWSDPQAAYLAACRQGKNMSVMPPAGGGSPTPQPSSSPTPSPNPSPSPQPAPQSLPIPQPSPTPSTILSPQSPSQPYPQSSPQPYPYPPSLNSNSSPYAQYQQPMTPFGMSAPPISQPYTQPSQTPYSSQPTSQSSITYPNTSQTTTPVTFPSASIIIAQPASIKKGSNVIVSWASVGTSCKIFQDGNQIAQGVEGTKVIVISTTSTQNTIVFSEQCSTSGRMIEKSATVSVQ
ncbi:MAG: hypothetical protein Q8R25_00505 [bacterium]|nr:hypothetical protein [bacterium]